MSPMSSMSGAKRSESFEIGEIGEIGGTGLCPEAQADGVPCTALGRDCELCERARDWLPLVEPLERDPPPRPLR